MQFYKEVIMKKCNFILSIFVISLALVGCTKKNIVINGIADLQGKKIGVQSGTTGDAWAQESSKAASVAGFKSGIDAALDLKNGAIDAVILDELPAIEIVSKNADLKIIRDPYFAQNKEEYAIAVKKGNKTLLQEINATIGAMKDNGQYEELVNAFMPADGNIKIPTFKSAKNGSTVKLGTNASFPPFEYVEGKNIVGFDISMGERIADTCNAKLEIVDMAFDSLIPALQSGTIDFIAAGMSVTEERKKNVDFSDPYYASEQVIIVRK